MHVPLVGKSGITDNFSDPLELVPPSRACMQMLSVPGQLLNPFAFPGCDLLLPVGKSDDFGSVGPVLARSCVYPAIFT